MTSRKPGGWFRDPELARLRREWVAAFYAWRRVDGEAASVGSVTTVKQREAQGRYHDAETAYFARSRMLTSW